MDLKICNTGMDHAFMLAVTPKMSMTKQVIASPFKGDSAVSLKIKVNSSKELLKIKIRTRALIIVITIIALAIVGTLLITNFKEKKITEKENHIIELQLEQIEGEFHMELRKDPSEKLSNIEDLNTVLQPTKTTFIILKRWKIVHQIDSHYPYPETEIEEQNWIGINHFLYGDLDDEKGGAKAEMIYDENKNIDRDVFDYIFFGTISNHPVVKEAEERIEKQQ